MNKIVLLGNGFDLAHGIQSTFDDFVKNILENRLRTVRERSKKPLEQLKLEHSETYLIRLDVKKI